MAEVIEYRRILLGGLLIQSGKMKSIDLTHTLSSAIPSWDGSTAFQLHEEQIHMLTSSGTHIDAPALFFSEGMTIDQLSLDQLCGPACVIDVSGSAGADYEISLSDINRYEADYGPIMEHSIVIGFTGWSRFWDDPKAYRNADANGRAHFPTFALSAIQALVERNIAAVAIDTLAVESLDSSYPCHRLLLGAGKYIIENIANASLLPPKGAYLLALPLKIGKGGEAPARVIGWVDF